MQTFLRKQIIQLVRQVVRDEVPARERSGSTGGTTRRRSTAKRSTSRASSSRTKRSTTKRPTSRSTRKRS